MRPHRRQPTRLPRPWDSPGKNTGVGCHFLLQCVKVKSEREVSQLCPSLSDPMDCSLLGSSLHGIFRARVLEWGAIAFSAEPWTMSHEPWGKPKNTGMGSLSLSNISCQPGNYTGVSWIAGIFFTSSTTREVPVVINSKKLPLCCCSSFLYLIGGTFTNHLRNQYLYFPNSLNKIYATQRQMSSLSGHSVCITLNLD